MPESPADMGHLTSTFSQESFFKKKNNNNNNKSHLDVYKSIFGLNEHIFSYTYR